MLQHKQYEKTHGVHNKETFMLNIDTFEIIKENQSINIQKLYNYIKINI